VETPTKVPLKHVPGWVTLIILCSSPHPPNIKIYNHEAASPALNYRPVGRGGPPF